MVIAVDFDGTCVTHEYPKIGRDIGAAEVLRALSDKGHKLILWTMRDGQALTEAVAWFVRNELPLYGINKNPGSTWSTSPKAEACLYIDDRGFGVPLKQGLTGERPYVDWQVVKTLLKV